MLVKKHVSSSPKRPPRSRKENFSPVRFSKTFPTSVVALTTDVSVDFALAKSLPQFSSRQQAYLRQHAKLSVKGVFSIKQIHGRRVVIATKKKYLYQSAIPRADAVITQDVNIPIAVRTADCLPIFIYDPKHRAIATIHAGWRSTKKGIAEATLKLMRKKFGTRAKDLQVAFGPALRSCCYEVGAEFLRYFPQDVICDRGRLFFDLMAANKRQLVRLGVRSARIDLCRTCTFCQAGYASYRRDGEQATRMLSVMMLKGEK